MDTNFAAEMEQKDAVRRRQDGHVRQGPQTFDDLLAVKGIGPALAAKYGEALLALVRE